MELIRAEKIDNIAFLSKKYTRLINNYRFNKEFFCTLYKIKNHQYN